MSEDLIIKHCSPTLAGIKTGSLFSCKCTSMQETLEAINKFNDILIPKGVKIQLLKFFGSRVLVYVYRPQKLEKDLSDKYTQTLLFGCGYRCAELNKCISRLKFRVNSYSEFPHEIGLFLGYPPEDVHGFILNKGSGCKFSGYWKVYGDEERALKMFKQFKKCSDIYYLKWLGGSTISRLTVSSK